MHLQRGPAGSRLIFDVTPTDRPKEWEHLEKKYFCGTFSWERGCPVPLPARPVTFLDPFEPWEDLPPFYHSRTGLPHWNLGGFSIRGRRCALSLTCTSLCEKGRPRDQSPTLGELSRMSSVIHYNSQTGSQRPNSGYAASAELMATI